jgi:hypothetical protein
MEAFAFHNGKGFEASGEWLVASGERKTEKKLTLRRPDGVGVNAEG